MQDVVREVDTRAFPMEIAKQMLALGNDLNMGRGVVAYNEAEMVLISLISVLTTYHKVMWPERLKDSMDFSKQKNSIIRFITLKVHSPMLRASVARQLLDHMHYFPELNISTLSYEEVLDECEQKD